METCAWCHLTPDERKWLLTENAHWAVYLADVQDYPGRCVLVCKRHCDCLSALNDAEWLALKQLVNRLEACFKSVLGAELCNWSCLLNDFYKATDPQPHLHLHVRPRYKNGLTLHGTTYPDAEFAHHYAPKKQSLLCAEDFQALYTLLKDHLQ